MPCCKDYTCNPVSCLFLTQITPVNFSEIFLSFQFVFLRLSILVSGQRFVLLSENVVCFFFSFPSPPGWSGLQTCCQQQRRWGWSVFSFLLSAADWAVCRIFSSVCCRKCPPLLILCKKCVYWVWGQCFLEIALGIFFFFFLKKERKYWKKIFQMRSRGDDETDGNFDWQCDTDLTWNLNTVTHSVFGTYLGWINFIEHFQQLLNIKFLHFLLYVLVILFLIYLHFRRFSGSCLFILMKIPMLALFEVSLRSRSGHIYPDSYW